MVAFQIPQSGWEKLFISFIPTETGKTTAKTSKANVRNGSCKWADPIYETTRLLLDSKSKQYDDKLYRLVVGMGTSRSSILGEATINLADYADATQPSAIGLPLHGSDHGTILHVTVQLLTAKTGFREFEQQRDKGLQSGNNVNRESESSVVKSSSSELQIPDDQVNKAKTHIQLRSQSKELLSVVEETGVREEYSDSQVTCDGSSNASESYYADKHDPYSTHEVDSLKSRVSGSQSSPGDGSNHHKLAQRSGSDYSMDNDLVIAYEENHRLRGSLEVAESSISELKVELSVLQSHANEMGTETEKLAQELATEIASGQELAKEVTVLKSECSKFKNDLEQLKEMKSSSKYMERKIEQSGHQKQLRWVNGVLLVEDRIRELQEKIYIGFRESDFSFLHSDLEVLLSTVQDLKKGTVEALPLQHEALAMNIDEPESMLHFGKIPSSPLQEPGSTGVIDSTEGSHLELLSQLDIAKAERESLVRKMNQMECYYEALVQELEENQKRILGEFQSLRNEHSTCDFTISTCKAESESIRRDMNDQMVRFTEENHELGSINKELQRRATTSESALKRARLNYSIAVSQLQKDLDMLSFQVLSMFETNQNVLKEAFSDPPQHLVEDFQESDDTLVSNLRSKQPSGGDVLSDDLKKSLSLQENIYKKVEEELGEMSSANLYLDVYSGILKETLFEASDHIRKMKGKLEELSQQLELSNQSRDLLFRRLQTAAEDVHSLNGQNAYCLAKCNDLQLQNQMLEADLGNLSNENFLLMEKITECEALLMDYRVYKSKHEVVSAEKLELENLLEIRVLDNQNLRKDMESVKEELETLRSGIHELAISKETIQKDLEKERDIAALSLSAARSEIDDVKRRFKQGLHDMVAKLDTPNASLEKLQFQLDSFANKFKSSLESKERHVQHSEVLLTYLSSLELELQKMSSEDKNFIENIMGLDMMAEEFEMSKLAISELKQENQDLMMHVKNKSEESIKLLPELDRLKECLKCVNDELDVERDLKSKLEGTVASLTSQLESQRSELSHVRKLASDQESENFRVVKLLSLHEESLEKLSKKHSADVSLACQLSEMQETMISEDLKLTFVRSQYETWIEELGKQLQELESKHLDNEARLNQSLASEAHYIEENKELTNALKSLRMELETSVAQNLVFSDSINVLTCELEQYKDKVGVLELSLSNENNQHAVEVGQLKDLLAKSESEVGQYKELQMKLHDTEARLNHCLENEARYIKEHESLVTTLESLKLELEASIAHNAEISESNNQHAAELGQMKDMLAKSESEVGQHRELQMKLHDTEVRLNDLLKSEVHYIEENQKLSTTLESVRLELEASIVHNAEIAESNNVLLQWKDKAGMLEINLTEINNQHADDVGRLKDSLAKSESEVGQYKELQMKLHDTEARLNHFLENEAHYIEENGKLATELESLRLELEASVVQNAEISEKWKDKVGMLKRSLTEVKNQHAVEVGQLKDMLATSEVEVGQLKELEMKLHDTKERLDHCVKSEARYIEENDELLRTVESLRSDLDASIVQNASLSSSNNVLMIELEQYKDKVGSEDASIFLENTNLKCTLAESVSEVDGLLFSREESEMVSVVLKAKLEEQNDELIMLQNKSAELTKKLAAQILKTEEFKNLSIYLKELKDNADIAREKKDPEGPSESLRMAFVKEQYQTKMQELKQQLSVSKRHGEEMLFKLQDALDEIESRKKSEASQLRRIDELSVKIVELEAELQSATSDKPNYDRIQAELECALLSLECCKEEKEKLVALLQECEEEKSKIVVELSVIREQLAQKEENSVSDKHRHMGLNGSMDYKEVKSATSTQTGEAENPVIPINVRAIQHASADEESSLLNDSKQLTVVNDQFRAQHLRSCMEQLDEELEKMKNDNSLLPLTNYDPSFQDLQRELVQLRKEAVFKSFRDINELIKDMLEIKGKYVNVETELKEMHDRYSQLSLQFAEVEGERQKLMMTLKNVRSSRNMLRLNRSPIPIPTLEDHHPL
ncbi:EEIG1/EHBP1 N-terminal domain-containing protein [Cynara cardunculus var. scolymus]|uniref:EEIG1/EHBP1 N-terminal domain-containing protein n=1 Tax=Cynara cardunculus var. scolymus TaxID=59895 RepID=A0A118K4A3_CYNCS|nr:EEIG1/EHBP1 N-terminal domain-containing protein [Cynara cardunculus var. scolymus]